MENLEFVIENLCKSYETKEVLKNVNFTFESGKIYGLLGRNGSGKTTLFNCLNDDISNNGGRFYFNIDGTEKKAEPDDIGYVLSTPTVPEFLTGREFIKFFMQIHNENTKAENNYLPVEAYFDMVSLSPEDADKLMKDYSHGMKNKMQMIVSFILEPKLLLLDEPLTSLDVVVSEEMKEILKRMKTGRITILSTHILDLALDFCDEIVLLNHGQLEMLPKENLDTDEFRERIINALKEQ